MNKVIIIGSSFLEKDEAYMNKCFYKNNICVANEQYEKKLIEGFKEVGADFVFLSAPKAGPWPFNNKRMFIKGFSSSKYIRTVSYCSIYGILNHFKTKALIKEAKKIINEISKDDRIHVISCEAHLPYLKTLEYIKDHFNNCFSTLIVPDMPNNMIKAEGLIYTILKKRDVKAIQKICNEKVDSFFCFTPEINKKINLKKKKYLVREGIVSFRKFGHGNSSREKHCVFLGKTNRKNGIEILVNSAKYLPDNYVIDIYGSGDMDETLKTTTFKNVIFHGFLPPNRIEEIMRKADLFVSPRLPEGDYVMYSFPSKLFEYLSCYKHVVTYRLPCYFSDLDDILDYPEDYSPEKLAEKIVEVSNPQEKNDWELKVFKTLQKYSIKSIAFDLLNMDYCD